MDNRFSTMTEVRRVALAGLRGRRGSPTRCMFQQGIAGRAGAVLLGLGAVPGARRGDHRARGARVPARRPGRASACRSTSACSPTPTRCWCSASTTWSPSRRPPPEEIEAVREFLAARRHLPGASARITTSAPRDDPEQRAMEYAPPRRRAGAAPAALRPLHPLADEGPRHPGREPLRPAPRGGARDQQRIAPLIDRARPGHARLARRASRASTSTCTCRTTR